MKFEVNEGGINDLDIANNLICTVGKDQRVYLTNLEQ